ncbi:MurR/RpiR family transcriptional regulator [Jiangella asiatica]|uniref:MurR/RpiR family transcriptional regulator n=1 Tax=Jiangella asiatica TaxID=2530372 RepID=A0A4R5DGW7_9ACTN|nr:MurR/RpiR family transcriptional regulator [Jiangella asiatica]TDE09693.1 MurR/RpiR family transcriptional regulator [Jiangella asiatica]
MSEQERASHSSGETGEPGTDSIEVRIRAMLPALTPAERRVGEQILADPTGAGRSTITELAGQCQTSLTTVTRFCRALGLTGYPELRLALATDAGWARSRSWIQGTEISPDDPAERVLAVLVEADGRALEETASQLDTVALGKAVTTMGEARSIDIYAVSGSGALGLDLRLRLHHIGVACNLWSDVHDSLASAALLTRADVALGISHSGETREVIEPLGLARQHGATTIAITNFPRSPIAEVADVLLTTAARETTFRSGGLSARHAQMLVIDCIYIGIAQRTHVASENAVAETRNAVRGHRLSASTPATRHAGNEG